MDQGHTRHNLYHPAGYLYHYGKYSMRPLTAINLIILGSSFAIAFSLAAVLIVVLVLGDEYPRLQAEFKPLLKSLLVFVGMTTLAAASFYSLVRELRLRFWLQGAMWLGLAGTGWFYWP